MEHVTEEPQRLSVRLDWSETAAAPVWHVNQAIGQLGTPVKGIPDGIYLVLGNMEPPVIPDAETRTRIINELLASGAKISVPGRFHLSREAADEVVRILQETIAQYDAAVSGARGPVDQEEP